MDVLTSSSYGDPTANGGNSNFGSSSYEVHITATPDTITYTVTEIHADNLYNSIPLNDANNKGSYLDQGSDSYKYTDTVTVGSDGTRTETYSVTAGANETVTIHDKGTSAGKDFTFDDTLTSGLNYRDGLDPSGAASYKVDATKTQTPTVDETGPNNFHVNVGLTAAQEYHDKGGAAVSAPSGSSAQAPADVLTMSDVEDLHYVDHSEGAGVRDQFIIDGNGTNHYGDVDVTTTNADGSTSDVDTVDENRSAHTNLQDHGSTQAFSLDPAATSPTGGMLVTDVPYNATDIQDVSSNGHTVVQTGTDANNQALPRTSDATGSGDATETESGSYQNAPLSLNYDDPTSFSTHEVDPSPGATAAVMDVSVTSTPTTQQSGPVSSLPLPITVMTSGQSADMGVAGGVVGNVLSSLAQAQTPTPAADPATGTTGNVLAAATPTATGTGSAVVLAAAPPAPAPTQVAPAPVQAAPVPAEPEIILTNPDGTVALKIPADTLQNQIAYAQNQSDTLSLQMLNLQRQSSKLREDLVTDAKLISALSSGNEKTEDIIEFKLGMKVEKWMGERLKVGDTMEINLNAGLVLKKFVQGMRGFNGKLNFKEQLYLEYRIAFEIAKARLPQVEAQLSQVSAWKDWFDLQLKILMRK